MSGGDGKVGVTFCPGKHQSDALTGVWRRDLGLDLDAISAWGATIVVTLVTAEEMMALRVSHLGEQVSARGMRWLHLPIPDVSTPAAEWERRWKEERGWIHSELDAGRRVLVHCKGGLGRAGLVAARILIERGEQPSAALAAVRAARPGAIETVAQEQYLLRLHRGECRRVF